MCVLGGSSEKWPCVMVKSYAHQHDNIVNYISSIMYSKCCSSNLYVRKSKSTEQVINSSSSSEDYTGTCNHRNLLHGPQSPGNNSFKILIVSSGFFTACPTVLLSS